MPVLLVGPTTTVFGHAGQERRDRYMFAVPALGFGFAAVVLLSLQSKDLSLSLLSKE